VVPSFSGDEHSRGFYSLMATMSAFRLLGIGGAQQVKDAAERLDRTAIALVGRSWYSRRAHSPDD
jgi:hypothetical protein